MFRAEFRIGAAIKKESLKGEHVQRIRRHACINLCSALRRITHGASVTRTAIQKHAIDAEMATLRNTDRQFFIRFVDHAESRVGRGFQRRHGCGQVFTAHLGQCLPDLKREADGTFAASGTVLEMFFGIIVMRTVIGQET